MSPPGLKDFLVDIEFRQGTNDLNVPPTKPKGAPLTFGLNGLIFESHRFGGSREMTSDQVSFKEFCKKITRHYKVDLELKEGSLGYMQTSPHPDNQQTYLPINGELSFQNAIGTQCEESVTGGKTLKLFLWSPKLTAPVILKNPSPPMAPETAHGNSEASASKRHDTQSIKTESNVPTPISNAECNDSSTPVSKSLMQPAGKSPASTNEPLGVSSLGGDNDSTTSPAILAQPGFKRSEKKEDGFRSTGIECRDDESDHDDYQPSDDTDEDPTSEDDSVDYGQSDIAGSGGRVREAPRPGDRGISPNSDVEKVRQHWGNVEAVRVEPVQIPGMPVTAAINSSTTPSAVNHATQFDLNKLSALNPDGELQKPTRDEFDDTDIGLNQYKKRLQEYHEELNRREGDKLQHTLEALDKCQHLDEEKWAETCRFFDHKVELKQSHPCIVIPFFGRDLYPVQAHTTVWLLKMIHGAHGSAIMGLVMGLGKTTISYAVHTIQHTFNLIWDDIKKNPNKHCHEGSDADMVCPSNKEIRQKFHYDCSCARKSPTNFMKELLGFTLAFVPKNLIRNWQKEAKKCFPQDVKNQRDLNPLGIKVWRAHGKETLDPDQIKALTGRVVEQNPPELTGRPPAPHVFGTLENSKYFVLTTANSYNRRVEKKITMTPVNNVPEIEGPEISKHTGKPTKHKSYSVRGPETFIGEVGLFVRDEMHKERLPGSATIKTLEGIISEANGNPGKKQPRIIAMSGTPLTTGPANVASYLKCMVRETWTGHPVLDAWRGDKAIKSGSEWDNLISKQEMTPDISQRFIDELQEIIEEMMIIYKNESEFLDAGKVIILPPNHEFMHQCCLSEEWETLVHQIHDKETIRLDHREDKRIARHKERNNGSIAGYKHLQRNTVNAYYRSRLFASFPFLMKIQDSGREDMKLTNEEWTKKVSAGVWVPGTETDPYFRHLTEIEKSSAKLQELRRVWQAEWRDKVDSEGKLARVLFGSYFLVGAHIVRLFFIHKLGVAQEDVRFVHKGLTEDRIEEMCNTFNGDVDDDDEDENDVEAGVKPKSRKRKGRKKELKAQPAKPPRLLIGTTSCFGEGRTFSKAMYVALLEPDFRVDIMKQFFARHHRLGNINKVLYSVMFLTANNPVETRIMRVNKARGEIMKSTQRKVGGNGKGKSTNKESVVVIDDDDDLDDDKSTHQKMKNGEGKSADKESVVIIDDDDDEWDNFA